ncbi:hypothetical protein [Maribacter flavus]|uniref:Uncharacterized protein n=1 Tax=Maribacter flavus TaxID=1658664 RepID=A0A5B2TV51_9FLAO|nr:hypothetical protein [Maribacter flavus]KAA2218367.1 hypothetical protein F0361_01730 [Maribacter flavus]
MQLSKKTTLMLLGSLALLVLIGVSYLNKSIFLEQILVCSFIIGLTGLVHLLGDIKKMEQDNERAEGKS